MGAQRGDDTEPAAGRGRAPVPQSRIRRHLSEGARGALLRPAVREQGPGGGSRHEVGASWSSRCSRPATTGAWPIVFDTSPCAYRMQRYCQRTARGPGQHRVHPRYGAAASRDRAWARAGRRASGVQRAQDGHGGQADGHCRALQSRSHRGRRRAVLRLRGRKGLQSPGTERIRVAPSEGRHSGRLHAAAIRRAERARSACPSRRVFPIARSSIWSTRAQASARERGKTRTRRPSPVAGGMHPMKAGAVHPLLRGRLLPRGRHRDARVARAPRRGGGLPSESDLLRAADGEQRMPRRCGGHRSAVRQEFHGLRLYRHALRQLHAPRAREPHRHSPNRGDGQGPAAHLRAGRVRARRAQGPRVPVGGIPACGGAAQRLRVVAGAADRQDVRDRRALLFKAARSAVQGERNPLRHARAARRVLRLRGNVFSVRGARLRENGLRQGDRPQECGRGIHRIRRHVLHHASEGMRGAPGPSDQVHPYRADPERGSGDETHRPRRRRPRSSSRPRTISTSTTSGCGTCARNATGRASTCPSGKSCARWRRRSRSTR